MTDDVLSEAIRAVNDAVLQWAEACTLALDALAQALKPMFERFGKLAAALAEATPCRPPRPTAQSAWRSPRPTAPRLLRLAAQSAWCWHWDTRYGRR